MTEARQVDWNPRTEEVLADQIAAYDRMRRTCPVAYGTTGNWAVFKHADVVRVLDEHEVFSNTVSRHLAVPNGMDPPVHTTFRAIVDRYYTPDRMLAFEPMVRAIAADLIGALPRGEEMEVMAILAEPYANRAQCAFMGWPDSMHEPLRQWTKKNQAATLAQDREALSAVAVEFDGYIREQLEARRAAGADAPADPTTELLNDRVDGRRLTDDEIVSIVRNWTVGELGTIAASVGIIAHFIASHPHVQERLRSDVSLAQRASDEILRLHAPLIANRRRTSKSVTVAGRDIPAQERVLVVWHRRTGTRTCSATRTSSVWTATPISTCSTAGHPLLPGRSARPARAPGDHGRAVRRNGEHRARSQRAEHERDLPGVGVRVAVAAVPVGSGTGRPMASLEVPSRNDGGMEV